jgi:hypothetical protein
MAVIPVMAGSVAVKIRAPFVKMVIGMSFMPAPAMAAMIPVVKAHVIITALPVLAPMGIVTNKIFPVMGMPFIPHFPLRTVPFHRSDDVSGGIIVIRGPSVSGTEVMVQYAVLKPVTVVIGPRRIRPDPRRCVRIRGWRWVGIGYIPLGITRRRHGS